MLSDVLKANANQVVKSNVNSALYFKKIDTEFGGIWGANGIINIQIMPKDGVTPNEYTLETIKKYFKTARYPVSNDVPKSVLELLPKELVADLLEARNMGLKKVYLMFVNMDPDGNRYIQLKAKKFVPKDRKQSKPDVVCFMNINRESSTYYRA